MTTSRRSRGRHLLAIALVLLFAALAVTGCGSSGSSSTGGSSSVAEEASTGGSSSVAEETPTEEAEAPAAGSVEAVWEQPASKEDSVGYELLKAGDTEGLAKSLAETFELPNPLTIKGVNGFGGGPFYNPEDNSITLPYQFATVVFEVIAKAQPNESETEIGEAVGAVNSFVFAHEFGHALIHNFELPVLGREEDAADGIATVLLLRSENGAVYAADAAEFWTSFSGRQNPPKLAEYADNHSFDRQRADNILCWVAGSDERVLQALAKDEVLPEDRLASCPAEWQLLRGSVEQVLTPHVVQGVNLEPSGN
ncbi:MAG: hypothetical protein JST59_14360 [Actinobacteria bacterium]|nr:hypothetical protein [Actinomycetota bacterium]